MIIDSEFLNLKRSTKLVKRMLGNLFPDESPTLIECNDDKAIKSGVRFRALVPGIELTDSSPFAYTVFNLSDGSVYHGISWAMGEGHSKEGLTFADCDYTGSPCGSDYKEKRDNLTPEHFLMIIHTLVPTPEGYGGWSEKVQREWLQENLGQLESDLIAWSRDKYRGVTSNKSNGGINGGGGGVEHSLETCDAMSDDRKGKPSGRGQAIYIKESNGSEHIFGSATEAADFLVDCERYSHLDREQTKALVANRCFNNKKSLKTHDSTGLLICYASDQHNPVRKARKQRSGGVVKSHNKREYYDRSTGERINLSDAESLGIDNRAIRYAAKMNSHKPFVCHYLWGQEQGYKKKYFFCHKEDLSKSMTPPLHQHPLALITNDEISSLEIFDSLVGASKMYGRNSFAWNAAANFNSKLIEKGTAPNRWRKVSATYTAIHLHELPEYCRLTDQQMPVSLLWYVSEIAEHQATNPHGNSKQSLARAA